jgi:hypothetical protein
MSPESITTQMLRGDLGANPTVQASLELYVDGAQVGGAQMSVELICAATVTSFDYDTKLLKVATEKTGDFAGRRFVITQKDPTKVPTFAALSFSMDGSGANWLDDEGSETLFTVRSSGLGQSYAPGFYDNTNQVNQLLARGGIYATSQLARHKFDMNGAVILSIVNAGPDAGSNAEFSGWSAVRLMLKDAAHLDASAIKATAYLDESYTSVNTDVAGRTSAPGYFTYIIGPITQGPLGAQGDAVYLDNVISGVVDRDQSRITIDTTVQSPGHGVAGDYGYQIIYSFESGQPAIITSGIQAGQVILVNNTPATLGRAGEHFVSVGVYDRQTTFNLDGTNVTYAVNGQNNTIQPANVHLGPVVEGVRFLNLAFPPLPGFHHFDPTLPVTVVIEAPILKYLLVWEKSTQKPVLDNRNYSRDSTIEVYYNPKASYSSGVRRPASLSQWTKMSDQKLAVDLELFIALEGALSDSTPVGGWRPDIFWGNPASDSTTYPPNAVASSFIPHAVRNVDITVNATPVITVDPGTERGYFS